MILIPVTAVSLFHHSPRISLRLEPDCVSITSQQLRPPSPFRQDQNAKFPRPLTKVLTKKVYRAFVLRAFS
jgi:hypothetical protein